MGQRLVRSRHPALSVLGHGRVLGIRYSGGGSFCLMHRSGATDRNGSNQGDVWPPHTWQSGSVWAHQPVPSAAPMAQAGAFQ